MQCEGIYKATSNTVKSLCCSWSIMLHWVCMSQAFKVYIKDREEQETIPVISSKKKKNLNAMTWKTFTPILKYNEKMIQGCSTLLMYLGHGVAIFHLLKIYVFRRKCNIFTKCVKSLWYVCNYIYKILQKIPILGACSYLLLLNLAIMDLVSLSGSS